MPTDFSDGGSISAVVASTRPTMMPPVNAPNTLPRRPSRTTVPWGRYAAVTSDARSPGVNVMDGVTYDQLHDRLKAQGYVIYAGQGQLEHKIFRVANMGALTETQLTGFLDAFEQACKPV